METLSTGCFKTQTVGQGDFLTSTGQSDESDRVWRLLSPSQNVKKQTNKLTCGLIESVYQKSEKVDADDTFPIDGTAGLHEKQFYLH